MTATPSHHLNTGLRASRRQLLRSAPGLALAAGGIRLSFAQSPADAGAPRLVVLLLRGAMDGLSVLVPHGDPAYHQSRGSIAIARPGDPDGALPLDSLFGLHPALSPLMPYWQSGRMAFIPASGSHDDTRSHFDAQDYMESGTPGRKSTPDGWLNRLAGVLGRQVGDPMAHRLQSVNLGPTMPRIFAGEAVVASLASGQAALMPGALERPGLGEAFLQLYGGEDRLSLTVREAAATRRDIMARLASDDPKADQGALSLNGLSQDTARLGQLMARDARVRLAFVPIGGWDTHANQGGARGQLATRLALLSQAIDALAKGLGERFAQTTVLVMSEFGRTVRQNGTGGTDHGHGNLAWVMGGGLRAGLIAGRWPGLDNAALHEGRDLAVTTDFRDIIADVLESRFRLDDQALQTVLPGMSQRQRVGLFA